jgi:hypothetical protein
VACHSTQKGIIMLFSVTHHNECGEVSVDCSGDVPYLEPAQRGYPYRLVSPSNGNPYWITAAGHELDSAALPWVARQRQEKAEAGRLRALRDRAAIAANDEASRRQRLADELAAAHPGVSRLSPGDVVKIRQTLEPASLKSWVFVGVEVNDFDRLTLRLRNGDNVESFVESYCQWSGGPR